MGELAARRNVKRGSRLPDSLAANPDKRRGRQGGQINRSAKMSLDYYLVDEDKFEPLEECERTFPCCVCKHVSISENEHPCKMCGHCPVKKNLKIELIKNKKNG